MKKIELIILVVMFNMVTLSCTPQAAEDEIQMEKVACCDEDDPSIPPPANGG